MGLAIQSRVSGFRVQASIEGQGLRVLSVVLWVARVGGDNEVFRPWQSLCW